MPDFSAGATRSVRAFSTSIRDFRGRSRSTRHIIATDTSAAQVTALRTAIGNMSNGRVMGTSLATDVEIINPADPINTTYDESYSTTDHVAVMVFQNGAGDVQTAEVPAPDASIFESDGETVDRTNGLVIAYLTAALAALNAGTPAGTWAFARGFLSTRARNSRRQPIRLPLAEPGAGDNPPDAPGV